MIDFTKLDKLEVADIVKNWLEEERHTVQNFDDENSDINYLFQSGLKNINIAFPKTSKNKLIILGKIVILPDEQNVLKRLKINKEFLSDIKIDLLRLNLNVTINKTNNVYHEFIITDIIIQKAIYFDGLTKDRFYDRLTAIFNCLTIIVAKFQSFGGKSEK
jgi:hypothetical protein